VPDSPLDPASCDPAVLDDEARRTLRTRAVADAVRARLGPARRGRAMDVGAGAGGVSVLLADLFDEVVLVDVDPEALADAAAALAGTPAAVTGGTTVRGVLVDLSAEHPAPVAGTLEPVDVVYAVMSAHHIRDLPRLLRAVHGLLVPGGRLFIADLEPDGGAFHLHLERFDGHDGFDVGTLSAWLTAAGFVVDSCERVHVVRKVVDGAPRDFPLFLVTATRRG